MKTTLLFPLVVRRRVVPTPLRRFLGLLFLAAASWGVVGQEMGFTVQGRLTESGKPSSGLFDFYFALKADPGGEPLAEVIRPAVAVRDGVFSEYLTFRPAFFDVFYSTDGDVKDAGRYLEVAVRPTEVPSTGGPPPEARSGAAPAASPPAGFTLLQPAIRVTPAPTAITAASAYTVSSGSITATSLSGLTVSPTLSGLLAIQSGGRFTVVSNPAPAWGLSGNAGTVSGNFLGTIDARPLELRVNNVRALLVEPSGTSPNLVGGSGANAVTGAVGAVIGGGGSVAEPQRVTADHGFLGGGLSNWVGGVAGTVGGGSGNAATNGHATVGGGRLNLAGGVASTVAGGSENRAAFERSTVGGGSLNVAAGPAATVAGGESNEALLDQATVGGGGVNRAAGPGATVGGGIGNKAELDLATVSGGGENWARQLGATVGGGVGNQAQAVNATVGGGSANFALGPYSIIPGGTQARAGQHGQMAQSAGAFQGAGDAQSSVFILRGTTSVAAPGGQLSLDGMGQALQVEPGRTLTFEVLVTGRSQGLPPNFSVSGGYSARGVVKNVGGTVSFVGTPVVTELGEDDPAWQVRLLTGPGSLVLSVNSAATPDVVRWVARVHTAEAAW